MDIIWITTLVIAVIALLVAIGLVFAGKKFAVAVDPREVAVREKLHSGSARFVKKYLSSDLQAAGPEEVGYIIVIEDSTEVVGTYKLGSARAGSAYRIHSTLRLFDCHTGSYVGDPITLDGGDPPKSIKSSKGAGYGSRPDPAQAVRELVSRVR